MTTSRASRMFGFGAVAVAVLVGAQPASADTQLDHTGTVGFHRLTDTSDRPGARCTYRQRTPSSYWWEGKLRNVDVRPPKMRAVAGRQKVGWRFIVERRAYGYSEGFGPWRTTYRSSLQTAMTGTTTNADFARMGVSISVPTKNADQSPEYLYRIRVKMFWFDGAGDVTGTANHRVDWYRVEEMDSWSDNYPCRGWYAWELN